MEFPELRAEARLINDKILFEARAGDKAALRLDYPPPHGDGAGYTPLELILISLSVCLATSVKVLLTAQKKEVRALRLEASGIRRTAHPTAFSKIKVQLYYVSDLEREEMEALVKGACERICPVYALLKGNVEMAFEVIREQ